MIYYLSLGSNINPEQHISSALEQLCKQFHAAIVFPVLRTQPCAIHSQHSFLNTIAIVVSDWSAAALKTWLNQLEEQHGRDRNDPLRSEKDRTLDIDILTAQSDFRWLSADQFDEPYIRASFMALQQADNNTVALKLGEQSLGHQAATIHTHDSSGHVLVVEDSLDGLLQCFETALHRQQSLA